MRAFPSIALAVLLAPALSMAAAENTIVEYAAPAGTPKASPPAPYTDAQFAYQYFVPKAGDPNQRALYYRLFTPPGYATSAPSRHPLVFFLHGDGEKENGTIYNQTQMRDNGQYAFCSAADQAVFPCFYALVQTSWYGRDGGAQTAADLAAALAVKYRIDPDRVFVTGLSGGGGASLAWACKQPGTWAGCVPLSAPTPGDAGSWLPANLATIPVWFFAAADDGTIKPANQDGQVQALRQLGARPIYTLYANGGHSRATWGSAYATMPLVQWMAGLRRGQARPQPVEVAISAPTAAGTWTTTAASTALAGSVSDTRFGGIASGVTGVGCISGNGASAPAAGIASWSTTANLALAAGETWMAACATGSSFDSARGGITTYCDVTLVRRGTAANTAPVPQAGADQAIVLPAAASLAGSASDDGLPAGSLLSYAWSVASGPGSVVFAAAASPATTATFSTAGTYVLRLTASDGSLSASDTVTIMVADAPPVGGDARILVDLGSSAMPTAGNWNNLVDSGAGLTVADCIDDAGVRTGVSATAAGFAWPGTNGVMASTLFPASAQADFLYVTGSAVGTVSFAHLDPTATWDVEIFASRQWLGTSVASYTVGGQTRTLAAYGNTANAATFTGLVASSGNLTLEVAVAGGATEACVGVIVLTRHAAPVAADRTVLIDLGSAAATTGGFWNDLTAPADGRVADAVDDAGVPTGIAVAVGNAFDWSNDQGLATSTLFPASAAKDGFYVLASGDGLGTIVLGNLDPTLVYDVELFASRQYNTASTAAYTVGGSTQVLNAYNNTSQVAAFTGLTAVGGTLTIEVRPASPADIGYLGVIRLRIHPPAAVSGMAALPPVRTVCRIRT